MVRCRDSLSRPMPEPDFLKSVVTADSILIVEQDGTISWCNAQAALLFGVKAGMRLGAGFDIPVEILERKRGEDVEICLQNERTRGESRWFSVKVEPVSSAATGKTGSEAVTCHDITERRRMTDALRKSEELYRFLSESMPQFVWTLNE